MSIEWSNASPLDEEITKRCDRDVTHETFEDLGFKPRSPSIATTPLNGNESSSVDDETLQQTSSTTSCQTDQDIDDCDIAQPVSNNSSGQSAVKNNAPSDIGVDIKKEKEDGDSSNVRVNDGEVGGRRGGDEDIKEEVLTDYSIEGWCELGPSAHEQGHSPGRAVDSLDQKDYIDVKKSPTVQDETNVPTRRSDHKKSSIPTDVDLNHSSETRDNRYFEPNVVSACQTEACPNLKEKNYGNTEHLSMNTTCSIDVTCGNINTAGVSSKESSEGSTDSIIEGVTGAAESEEKELKCQYYSPMRSLLEDLGQGSGDGMRESTKIKADVNDDCKLWGISREENKHNDLSLQSINGGDVTSVTKTDAAIKPNDNVTAVQMDSKDRNVNVMTSLTSNCVDPPNKQTLPTSAMASSEVTGNHHGVQQFNNNNGHEVMTLDQSSSPLDGLVTMTTTLFAKGGHNTNTNNSHPWNRNDTHPINHFVPTGNGIPNTFQESAATSAFYTPKPPGGPVIVHMGDYSSKPLYAFHQSPLQQHQQQQQQQNQQQQQQHQPTDLSVPTYVHHDVVGNFLKLPTQDPINQLRPFQFTTSLQSYVPPFSHRYHCNNITNNNINSNYGVYNNAINTNTPWDLSGRKQNTPVCFQQPSTTVTNTKNITTATNYNINNNNSMLFLTPQSLLFQQFPYVPTLYHPTTFHQSNYQQQPYGFSLPPDAGSWKSYGVDDRTATVTSKTPTEKSSSDSFLGGSEFITSDNIKNNNNSMKRKLHEMNAKPEIDNAGEVIKAEDKLSEQGGKDMQKLKIESSLNAHNIMMGKNENNVAINTINLDSEMHSKSGCSFRCDKQSKMDFGKNNERDNGMSQESRDVIQGKARSFHKTNKQRSVAMLVDAAHAVDNLAEGNGRKKYLASKMARHNADFVDPTTIKLDQDDEMEEEDDVLGIRGHGDDDTSDEDWMPERRDDGKMGESHHFHRKSGTLNTNNNRGNVMPDGDTVKDGCDKGGIDNVKKKRFGGIMKLSGRKGKPFVNNAMTCQDCGKIFHGSYHLKRHLLSHTENRPHHCLTCGKRFKQKAHLHGHEIVHLREKSRKKDKSRRSSSSSGNSDTKTTNNLDNDESNLTDGLGNNNNTITSNANKCPGRPKKVYSEKELSCDICGKLFKTLYRLKRHVQSHTDLRPYTCKVCGKGFKQTGHRNEHEANHEKNRRKFLCNMCGVIFRCRSSFNNHLKTHRFNKQIDTGASKGCAKRIYSFMSSSSASANNYQGQTGCNSLSGDDDLQHTGYDCPYCTDKFATAQGLNRHLESHIEVNQRLHVQPYSCQMCSRSFTYKHNLTKHILTHQAPEKYADFHKSKLEAHLASGKPSYTCQVCSKVFIRKETLAKHSKIHTGTKPFKCLVCQKEFTQNVHMKVHMRKHTGNRPFQCKRCNRGFIDSTALAKHVEYEACNSENVLFHCTICEKRHYYLGSIKQHIKKEHQQHDVDKFISRTQRQRRQKATESNGVDNSCKICSTSFSEKGNLIRHVKRKHGDLLKMLNDNLNRCGSNNNLNKDKSDKLTQGEPDTRSHRGLNNQALSNISAGFESVKMDTDTSEIVSTGQPDISSKGISHNGNIMVPGFVSDQILNHTNESLLIRGNGYLNCELSLKENSQPTHQNQTPKSLNDDVVDTNRNSPQTKLNVERTNRQNDWTTPCVDGIVSQIQETSHNNVDQVGILSQSTTHNTSSTGCSISSKNEQLTMLPNLDLKQQTNGTNSLPFDALDDSSDSIKCSLDVPVCSKSYALGEDKNELDLKNKSNCSSEHEDITDEMEKKKEQIDESNANSFLFHVGLVEKRTKTVNLENAAYDPSHQRRYDTRSNTNRQGGVYGSLENCQMTDSNNTTPNYWFRPDFLNREGHRSVDIPIKTGCEEEFMDQGKNFRTNLEVFCDLALMTEGRAVRGGPGDRWDGSNDKGRSACNSSNNNNNNNNSFFNEFNDVVNSQRQERVAPNNLNVETSVTDLQLRELGLLVCKDAQLVKNDARPSEEIYAEFKPWLEQLIGNSNNNKINNNNDKYNVSSVSKPGLTTTNTDSMTPFTETIYSTSTIITTTSTTKVKNTKEPSLSSTIPVSYDNLSCTTVLDNNGFISLSPNHFPSSSKSFTTPSPKGQGQNPSNVQSSELSHAFDTPVSLSIPIITTPSSNTTNIVYSKQDIPETRTRDRQEVIDAVIYNHPGLSTSTVMSFIQPTTTNTTTFRPQQQHHHQQQQQLLSQHVNVQDQPSLLISKNPASTPTPTTRLPAPTTAYYSGKDASVQTPTFSNSPDIQQRQPTFKPQHKSSCLLRNITEDSKILHSLLGGAKMASNNNTGLKNGATSTVPNPSTMTEAVGTYSPKLMPESTPSFIPANPMDPLTLYQASGSRPQVKVKGPFQCHGCGKCFIARHQLKRHELTHTEIRPYRCAECGKAFRQKVHLSDHMKRHRGHRPFLCQACGKRFVLKNELKQHIKNYCRKDTVSLTFAVTVAAVSSSSNGSDGSGGGSGSGGRRGVGNGGSGDDAGVGDGGGNNSGASSNDCGNDAVDVGACSGDGNDSGTSNGNSGSGGGGHISNALVDNNSTILASSTTSTQPVVSICGISITNDTTTTAVSKDT